MTDAERIAYVDFLRGNPLPSMMVGGILHYGRIPADLCLAREPHSDDPGVVEAVGKPLAAIDVQRPRRRKVAEDAA